MYVCHRHYESSIAEWNDLLVPVWEQTLYQLFDGGFPLRSVASIGRTEHARSK